MPRLAEELRILHAIENHEGMEGRFNACAAAYMRLHGGVRADKGLRNDLNAWGPVCRKHQSATTLEEFARSTMSGSAVTVTNIHQAKGMEWDYVFVVGVTDACCPTLGPRSKAPWTWSGPSYT